MKSSAELLRDHHLRVTAARVAVFEVLAEQSHLTTDEVAAGVRQRIGAVSTQAVYHMLSTLTSAGLLRRFELAGGAARHERRVGDNHPHLVLPALRRGHRRGLRRCGSAVRRATGPTGIPD